MECRKSLQSKKCSTRRWLLFTVVCLLVGTIEVVGCASHAPVPTEKAISSEVPANEMPPGETAPFEEKWGVRIVGVRLTANSYMIDFRFKVVDSEKASPLMDRNAKPYLIDEANNTKFNASDSSIGSLRSKGSIVNRNYFILFGNPGTIQRGSKVTIVIGDFKADHLTVE